MNEPNFKNEQVQILPLNKPVLVRPKQSKQANPHIKLNYMKAMLEFTENLANQNSSFH